jgi:UDP:flavonoid glycosyltransferase YjiC (YdhE family)
MGYRSPRILLYAVNGLGLGHVTRLLAIARKVRALEPGAEIVFFTSSEAEDVIYREGFAAFKIPSKNIRAESGLRPITYSRMIQTVTLNLLASFHPHLLVVDTFPAGAIQELLPVLRWDMRRIFVFREQREEVSTDSFFQNVLKMYDLALIPHAPDSVHVPLPDGLDSVWTGPIIIRDRHESKERVEARRVLGLPEEEPILYVTFGGGGDKEIEQSIQKTVLALAGMVTARGSLNLAISIPPLFRGSLSSSKHVFPVNYYPMAEMYSAFDGAISATGYNTAMELLHHGVPAIFIPFLRQVDDQESRAKWISSQKACIYLATLDEECLRSAAKQILDTSISACLSENGRNLAPVNGAETAAKAILALLE